MISTVNRKSLSGIFIALAYGLYLLSFWMRMDHDRFLVILCFMLTAGYASIVVCYLGIWETLKTKRALRGAANDSAGITHTNADIPINSTDSENYTVKVLEISRRANLGVIWTLKVFLSVLVLETLVFLLWLPKIWLTVIMMLFIASQIAWIVKWFALPKNTQ